MTMHSGDYRYHSFDAMGTAVRFWIDRAADPHALSAMRAGETFIREFDARLSRFRPDSELTALNDDPAEMVEVSTLMLRFVAAAVEAARISQGLVDPTLTAQIEQAGYRDSRAGVKAEPLASALEDAPPVAAAAPNADMRWRAIKVDSAARTVTRPPGLRLDSGGCGKGLAADMLAAIWQRMLPAGTAFIVDCGGDMRLGELEPNDDPYVIAVETIPVPDRPAQFELRGGGIATSGIGSRVWRHQGKYAHHLIDPASGRPAWTGVASATALAPTALMAETAAKTALLSGPDAARIVLSIHGGLIVDYQGGATAVEPRPMEVAA